MIVFRSIVVPIKAVIMNLLSIGAAYGVMVAVFQWGWGKDLIGVGKAGPIESFLPMMLFAILFGLSMDYEVFLLSRMKEEYDSNGNDNREAVADGLASTARVITAAAAIMVCVFGSFVFGDNRVVKEFGLGLAFAVLIDATVVRMILVPATMELLGDANWWFPKWLGWLPKIHIEGKPAEFGAGTGVDHELSAPDEDDRQPQPVG
jgi:RND superfamily putative drug exporter